MADAQERFMDAVASFRSGKILPITEKQYNVPTQSQNINLLAVSNRYGYVFYATETDGLVLIPSAHIDRESRFLGRSAEDDDDDDNHPNGTSTHDQQSIIQRSYIPGQGASKTPSTIPHWLSLNADETILAIILSSMDHSFVLIILYDVVKLIQTPNSQPLVPPTRLSGDDIGGSIQQFAWNPALPNLFAYIDANGTVSTFSVDPNSKELKNLGKSEDNQNNNSSICWSPKGKQLAVATFDGVLKLYEPNMTLKKTHPPLPMDVPFPPCINVLWLSTHQFLLAFSEDSPDENANQDTFFHVMLTYEKDQPPKMLIYPDLFFDARDVSMDINPQYFYAQLNESKMIVCGLSKSSKINVLGPDELNQDVLNVWTFADQFRPIVKGLTNVEDEPTYLTGMALALNSSLSISEKNQKLPPCPILLLSNSKGLLQVYYFVHKNLPNVCRKSEELRPIQAEPTKTSFTAAAAALPSSSGSLQSFLPAQPPPAANGFSFSNFNVPAINPSTNSSPAKEKSLSQAFGFDQQPTNGLALNNLPKQTPTKVLTINEQPVFNSQKLLQMVKEFETRLKSLEKPFSHSPDSSGNLDGSIESLRKALQEKSTSIQTSIKTIKSMTSEHIESMTKIENARHQIKLSQKENLYHKLKDRELDPWTQSRLDSIKTKYDQLKQNLAVLLQLTHTTIHDKSSSANTSDTTNEDFLPDLEISDTQETMKQCLHRRFLELSRKVSETDKDLQIICAKLNTDILSSKRADSTFTKTTMSSSHPFHSSDAQILEHLRATHPEVIQIRVPSPTVIHSTTPIEQKESSIVETTKSTTPSILQSTTSKPPSSPSVDPKGFENMLRIVRTSIDLFSGVTSPEHLQELSNTITTSPLSSAQKSNNTSIIKTPTVSKSSNQPKAPIINKPLSGIVPPTNIVQTPAKSISSAVPMISVTPATPAAHTLQSNTSLKLEPTRPATSQATDLSKTQTISTASDSAIRSLLGNSVQSSTTVTTVLGQPTPVATSNQAVKSASFGIVPGTTPAPSSSQPLSTPVIATAPVTSLPTSLSSPFGGSLPIAATSTTSVQATSPTTRPVSSTSFSDFGSRPTFGGNAFNLPTSTASTVGFGNTSAVPSTTTSIFGAATVTTTSAPSIFGGGGSGFGASPVPAMTSASITSPFGALPSPATSPFGAVASPSTSPFGGSAPLVPSPFGSGFGAPTSTAPTAPATNTGSFGSSFGAGSSGTSIFGSSSNTGLATATSTTTTTPSTGSFGGGFNGFGGFGATSTAPTSTIGGSVFGSTGFAVKSTLPATSVASPAAGSSIFGSAAGTSPFGSSFAGFASQTGSTGSSTGFSFNGFGSQPSDAASAPSSFGSFGSPPAAATQAASPFGATMMGGASAQPTGFGAATPSFGSASAQSPTSPSFTAYRK